MVTRALGLFYSVQTSLFSTSCWSSSSSILPTFLPRRGQGYWKGKVDVPKGESLMYYIFRSCGVGTFTPWIQPSWKRRCQSTKELGFDGSRPRVSEGVLFKSKFLVAHYYQIGKSCLLSLVGLVLLIRPSKDESTCRTQKKAWQPNTSWLQGCLKPPWRILLRYKSNIYLFDRIQCNFMYYMRFQPVSNKSVKNQSNYRANDKCVSKNSIICSEKHGSRFTWKKF